MEAQRQSTVSTISDPIIISVPHSGTRFLKDRLKVTEHIHTNLNWEALMEKIDGRPLIAPMRKPTEVWRSWCRRRNPEEDFPYLSFAMSYGVMHTLDQLFDIDFICLETQSDPRITDWRSVGDQDYGPWELRKLDLRPIYKLPFVQRYYGSWA